MKTFQHLFLAAALAAVTCSAPLRAGLIINATFDDSIANDINSAAIEATILSAVSVYQNTFTNNITVPIYFQEGGGLGGSSAYVYGVSYSDFHAGLTANNANPAALADLNSNGGNGTNNPVTGTSDIQIKSANGRAVGISIGPDCQIAGTSGNRTCLGSSGPAYDGIISLNTNITYPPQITSSSYYELFAVTEHEIDEILGLGSALHGCNGACGTLNGSNDTFFNAPAPEDLWRYASNGTTRTLSTNCALPTSAYFAIGGTQIAEFNNACNGADFGDWATSATPQIQDAFGHPGTNIVLGTSEIQALTAIGYTTATPEPATWLLFAGSIGAVALRRRTAAKS